MYSFRAAQADNFGIRIHMNMATFEIGQAYFNKMPPDVVVLNMCIDLPLNRVVLAKQIQDRFDWCINYYMGKGNFDQNHAGKAQRHVHDWVKENITAGDVLRAHIVSD